MPRLKRNACSFPGCFRPSHGGGLCVAHYRQKARGRALQPLGRYGERTELDTTLMQRRHFLSLGGGVQSTVMALMADRGLLGDMPEVAIFADTQWEPKAVYENVQWLSDTVTSFPVVTVTAGNLKEKVLSALEADGEEDFVSIPMYARFPNGKIGVSVRQCTSQYKIIPVEQEIRRRLNVEYNRRWPNNVQVVSWLGISLDEAPRRMSVNLRTPHIVNHYPLVDRNITRSDCRNWFREHYPDRELHRSACVGCPYHSVSEHARMATEDPEEWATLLEMDRLGQQMDPPLYFSSKGVPLERLVDDYERYGQSQTALLGEECTGHCHT